MALHKISKVRRASKKEARELSKLAWVRIEELSDHTFEARLLPDGRVLHYLTVCEVGNVYPSREALEKVLQETAKMPTGPIDLAVTLLPPLEDFLRDVESHARSLGRRIGVPDEVLDGSEKSLEAVDKRVWRIPLAKRQTRELVTPLVAYVGEVMRRASDGRWGRLPTTWEKQVPVFEPSAVAAHQAVFEAQWRAGQKAEQDALMQGASFREAFAKAQAERELFTPERLRVQPVPIRYDVVEEPLTGHENEPVVIAHNGDFMHPLPRVLDFVEGGSRGSFAGEVSGTLAVRGRRAPGQPGGVGNPAAS